jgi:hypothetical protein
MTQDNDEYIFYEERRLEEEMKSIPKDEKLEFLIGERSAARKRMIRLQEEVDKLTLFIELVKGMEKALDE